MSRSALLLALFGASVAFSNAYAVEPIKGSLTWGNGAGLHYASGTVGYGGILKNRRVFNQFQNELTGDQTAKEIYAVNSDGTLRLLTRWLVNNDHPSPDKVRKETPKPIDDEIDIPK